jgi:hypothetical protein
MTTPTSTPTGADRSEADPDRRVRFHRGRIGRTTFWWVSIDGTTYLHPDYPTKAAARHAALAYLTARSSKETTP